MRATEPRELALSDFDYDLPEQHIAQEPLEERGASRLLVLERSTGLTGHRSFADLPSLLRPGDLLVLNDTKVIPCRLPARKQGGGKAEIFLIREESLNRWSALIRGASGKGKRLSVGSGIEAEIAAEGPDGTRVVRFHGVPDIRAALESLGRTPLPPYIRRPADERDRERYQTVYAAREGAVAAPTEGLHFTGGMLETLRRGGIEIASVTLHVGPGTFLPVRSENLREHRMHAEPYTVSEAAARSIGRARAEGRRVIAVGTTSVRALESAADADGNVRAGAGETTLFILPGHPFKVVVGMITNFHLPGSTLLMLVAAFAGRERVLAAYREAVERGYRFYSYGDAMLIA